MTKAIQQSVRFNASPETLYEMYVDSDPEAAWTWCTSTFQGTIIGELRRAGRNTTGNPGVHILLPAASIASGTVSGCFENVAQILAAIVTVFPLERRGGATAPGVVRLESLSRGITFSNVQPIPLQ